VKFAAFFGWWLVPVWRFYYVGLVHVRLVLLNEILLCLCCDVDDVCMVAVVVGVCYVEWL